MPLPLISVIIPSYNAGKSIRNTLNSLLNQSFGDIEILIKDGCSKDNTINIVQEFANMDKRIRYISAPDRGIYDAMNKGVEMATGEWYYFLGADDTLKDSQVISKIADQLQQTDAHLVYGNVLIGNSKKHYDGFFDYEKLLMNNISHQAIFYRKPVFELVGVYNLRYKTHADWEFNLRCFKQPSIRTQYIDILIAHFALGGMSTQYDLQFMTEYLLPARIQYLNEAGTNVLRKINFFDHCWRLFRNCGIRSQQELLDYAGNFNVPTVFKNMISFQQIIPLSWIKTGIISKCCMLSSYVSNRLQGTI